MNTNAFGPGPAFGQTQQSSYDFWVRQAPEKARVVVKGKERDRKPIDPPPILQLTHRTDPTFLHNPYLFCKCWLWHESENRAVTNAEVGETKAKEGDLLIGQTSSSLHRLKDLDNSERGFFVFGDLSVAAIGKFRLRFCLWEYNVHYNTATFLGECLTRNPFDVSTHKEWDGIRESTVLSRTIADQGIKLRLRKESRHPRGRAMPPAASNPGSSAATPIRPNPAGGGSYGSLEGQQDPEQQAKRQRSIGESSSGGPSAASTPYGGSVFSQSSYPGYSGGNYYVGQGQYNYNNYPPNSNYGGQYQRPNQPYTPGYNPTHSPTPYNYSQYPRPSGAGYSGYGQSLPSLSSSTAMANPGSTPHLAPISTSDVPYAAQTQTHAPGQGSSYGGGYAYQGHPPG